MSCSQTGVASPPVADGSERYIFVSWILMTLFWSCGGGGDIPQWPKKETGKVREKEESSREREKGRKKERKKKRTQRWVAFCTLSTGGGDGTS